MKISTKQKHPNKAIVLKKHTKPKPEPEKSLASLMNAMKVNQNNAGDSGGQKEPFKFNFNVSENCSASNSEIKSSNSVLETNYKFVKSDNSFRFNFDNNT